MMALSAFDDLSREPGDDDVAGVLGDALAAWRALTDWLAREAGVDRLEWGSSGKRYGWGLRARSGARTIAYLIPQEGAFLVGLVLGDTALAAARSASLPAAVSEIIAGARSYAEGTGFRVPVSELEELVWVKELVRAKLL
jgi:hypothetical protein